MTMFLLLDMLDLLGLVIGVHHYLDAFPRVRSIHGGTYLLWHHCILLLARLLTLTLDTVSGVRSQSWQIVTHGHLLGSLVR